MMKKIGNFLLALVPAVSMIVLELLMEVVVILGIMFMELISANAKGMPMSLTDILNSLPQMVMDHYMLLLIMIQISWIVGFGLWYYFGFVRKKERLKLAQVFSVRSFSAEICLAVGFYFIITLYLSFAGFAFPNLMEDYNLLMEQTGIADRTVLSTISTIVFAPICEEVIFRGLTYKFARRAGLNFLLANILQALLFGIIHMNWIQGTYAFCLGLLLGFVNERYHSLYAAVLLHALFNFCGTYLAEALGFLPDVPGVYAGMAAVGVILVGISWYLLKKEKSVKMERAAAGRITDGDNMNF
ncbi:CPBP family intramembrane glutamic endopeptidase [Diplocloster agilis]|uniref:CPBP family intramembrane glutamic endopeptidase n=1 Tax=Diplocloster agilis TaxID=2850323 RepID=UPI000820CADA|nr:type II CAAX endopeptidase family protein [Suonthocola fibrivorans]MCU6734714.1 CPBP family intramembrane metalloprotease [Suonthocola fibrivorans]SCJ50880.1 CAAX amino terminal protease self-immunity [uncultured Clostridium sp.]